MSNPSARKLFQLMKQQDGSTERLCQCLNGNIAQFRDVIIGATTDFGVYYQIPYTDKNGVVTGFVVYPVDENKQNLADRRASGLLGTPISVDGEYLNTNIPVTHRMLYSSPLIEMKAHGYSVDNSLTSFAERASIQPYKLSSTDYIPTDEKSVLTRSNTTGTLVGSVSINYIMGTYWGTNFTDDEVTAYGFDINTFMSIVEKAFNEIGDWHVIKVSHHYYQKLIVTFRIINEDKVYANYNYYMDTIVKKIKNEVFNKQFTVSLQYLMSLPDRPQTPHPSGGGGSTSSSGGNYTGGTTGSSTTNQDEQDTLTFVQDSLCPNKEYIDSVKAVYELLGKTVGNIGYNTKKYEEYLKAIKGADVEYSTSLHDYGGEYAIDSIVKGEKYVVNNITKKYSVANIHNHPNNTPPSFRDILFTAKCAKDETLTMYKATFIYNEKDNSYYILYITNRKSAASFYDRYHNDLDEKTNGIKNNSHLDELSQDEGQDYTKGTSNLLYLNTLILSNNSGISMFKVKDEKITSYGVTRIAYGNKIGYKYSFFKL